MTAGGRESPLQGWFTPRGWGDRESGENYAPAVISTNKRGAETRGTRAPTSLAVFTREGANYFSKCHSLPPLFFPFFFFSLLSSPLPFPPSFCSRPPNHGDSIPRFVRSKGGEGGNGMNRCCCRFLGAGLFFFSLFLLLFSFFRSLFLYGARITQGKLNFCNVRTGKGGREGFVIDRSNDRSIRFFASCFLYIYIRVLIF